MKEIKLENIPQTSRKRVKAVICDICKTRSPRGDNYSKYWELEDQELNPQSGIDITVKMKEETQLWNDGGESKTTSFDICPKCFKEELIPFLESKGAKPEIEEVDW